MSSNRFWAVTFLALSSLGPLSSGVWAQTTMAACPSGWSWNENSLGQDPCAISSQLDAACRGVGSYTIPALNSTQNYVPPQKDSTYDLTCDCDTVMYSLYMACSTCQGGVIYSWPKWIAQCDTVYVTQYPHDVPYGTAIPHWAFYDVTTLPNETYSDTVAMSVGKDPEATAKPLSTATYKTSSGTRFGSTSTTGFGSNSTGSSNRGSTKRTPIAAIVGGIVAGVVVIALAVVVAVIISQRNKRRTNQPPLQPLPSQDMVDYQKVQPMSPMSAGGALPYGQPPAQNYPYNPAQGQTLPYNPSTSPGIAYPTSPNAPYNVPTSPGNPPHNLSTSPNPQQAAGQNPAPGYYYNPEDPTTFPPPMGDGQTSITYTNNTTAPGPGQYGGMPEL